MKKIFSLENKVNLKENSEGLIFSVIMLLIFIMAARTPVDNDLWWHLRIGEASWVSGHPILIDQFSFTKFGAVWTNHEWLSQIALYGLYRMGGFLAIGAVVALLASTSLAVVYFQMREPPLLKAFILVLAAAVAAPVWVPRAELASLVLLAAVGYLLYLYKWRQKDRLWLFIPLFILWSNLHGGYVLGLLLSGAMVAGEILNNFLGFKGPEILTVKRILRLLGWIIIAGLAVLINPNGIRMWLAPFQTVGISALQNYIVEWASPDFHQLFQQPFIWMVIALLASIGLSQRRFDGTDLASLAIFIYLSLEARRNFGPFSIVASPILGRYLWPAITEWVERIKPTITRMIERINPKGILSIPNSDGFVTGKVKLINYGLVSFLVAASILRLFIGTLPSQVTAAEIQSEPVGAVSWIQANHPKGELLNSYNWGGYLLWALRDYPVFVDGRTDLYSDEIINQWLQVVNVENGWQTVLDKWDINLILIEPNWPIGKVLPFFGWKILYQDDSSILFGR